MSQDVLKPRGKLDFAAVWKITAGIVLLFGGVALAGVLFKDRLESWAMWVSAHFGPWGMFFGTLLADAFHFPIPPQLYMMASIVAGAAGESARAQWIAFIAIMLGSLSGGLVAYVLTHKLSGLPYFERLLAKSRPKVKEFIERYGALAGVVASFSPIPFATICNLAGLYRMPKRLFALFLVLRIPRLILFYWVIRAGWHFSI